MNAQRAEAETLARLKTLPLRQQQAVEGETIGHYMGTHKPKTAFPPMPRFRKAACRHIRVTAEIGPTWLARRAAATAAMPTPSANDRGLSKNLYR